MTVEQWLKCLAEDPVTSLAPACDWFQEQGDPAWMLLHWLWQRTLNADGNEDKRHRFIPSPYIGPRYTFNSDGTCLVAVWWCILYFHDDGELGYDAENSLPLCVHKHCRGSCWQVKEKAWQAAITAARQAYNENPREYEKVLLDAHMTPS